jgi:hypothetical protein
VTCKIPIKCFLENWRTACNLLRTAATRSVQLKTISFGIFFTLITSLVFTLALKTVQRCVTVTPTAEMNIFLFSPLKFMECLWPLTCVTLYIVRTELDLCNRRFICLFNNALRNSNCTASNSTLSRQLIRKDVEGSSCDGIRCIPQAFTRK